MASNIVIVESPVATESASVDSGDYKVMMIGLNPQNMHILTHSTNHAQEILQILIKKLKERGVGWSEDASTSGILSPALHSVKYNDSVISASLSRNWKVFLVDMTTSISSDLFIRDHVNSQLFKQDLAEAMRQKQMIVSFYNSQDPTSLERGTTKFLQTYSEVEEALKQENNLARAVADMELSAEMVGEQPLEKSVVPAEVIESDQLQGQSSKPEIQIPGNSNREKNIYEAAKKSLCNWYGPEWYSEGFMLPAVPLKQFYGPVGQASGSFTQLNDRLKLEGIDPPEKMTGAFDNVRGDDAETISFETLRKLQEQEKFICFGQLQLNIGNLNLLQRFNFVFEQQEISKIFGKNLRPDFVILSRKKGLIIIEVKAASESKVIKEQLNEIHSKLSQLQKAIESVFCISKKNLILPFHKFLFLPNYDSMNEECKEEIKFPDDLRKREKNDFKEGNFSWWTSIPDIPDDADDVKSSGINKEDVYRTCAQLLTALRTLQKDIRPHKELIKKIDSGSFLETSHKIYAKSCDAAGEKKDKLSKFEVRNLVQSDSSDDTIWKLRSQFYFMSPEQLVVREGPPRQIIEGPPGSGKTLFIRYMASELISKNKPVTIISTKTMVQEYHQFLTYASNKLKITDPSLHICMEYNSFGIIMKNNELFSSKIKGRNLFFDDYFNSEVTLKPPEETAQMFEKLANSATKSDYLWIICDAAQAYASTEFKKNQYSAIQELLAKTEVGFQHNVLWSIMRNALDIANLVLKIPWTSQLIKTTEGLNDEKTAVAGNRIPGEVSERSFEASEKHVRLLHHKLPHDIKDKLIKQQGYKPQDIAIIVVDFPGMEDVLQKQINIVQKILETEENNHGFCNEKIKIPVITNITSEYRPPNYDASVKICKPHNVYSLEWPAVIVVTWADHDTVDSLNEADKAEILRMNQLAYSRAMYKLIVIKLHRQDDNLIAKDACKCTFCKAER